MLEDPGYRYLNLENNWSNKLTHQAGIILRSDGAITLAPALKADATILELPPLSFSLTGSFGISADANGNLYIADPGHHRILYRDACTGIVNPLSCLGGEGSLPGQLHTPRGVLVGRSTWPPHSESLLYILDSGNHRIQIIDLRTQQLQGIWGQLDPYAASEVVGDVGIFNYPQEMVMDRAGNSYLRDQINRVDQVHRIQKLNHDGQVDEAFTTNLTSQATIPQNPASLAIAPIDNQEVLIILDLRDDGTDSEKPGRLLIYHLDGTFDQTLSDRWNDLLLRQPSGLAVSADRLYVADVYVADGDRIFCIFIYNLQGNLQGEVQGLSQRISSLSLDEQGRLLVHPSSQGQVLRLIPSDAYASTGSFLLGPFRSQREAPTSWHRIQAIVDALPTNAHLQFYTCTSNSDSFTPNFPPSIPSEIQTSLAPNEWVPTEKWWAATQDQMDLLILNESALYLWIGVTSRGDGNSSPVLHQIRLDYNHRSWSQYLPAIYRQDTPQRVFLERTLALFESLTGAEETLLDRLPLLLDARSAPDASPNSWLDWLAGWLALELDESWTTEQRREAIANAFALYGRRGTVEGLRQLIRLYTQATVFIDEPAQHATPWSLGQSTLGFTTMLVAADPQGAVVGSTATLNHSHLIDQTEYGAPLFADLAHVFFVQVYAADLTPATEQKLRQILDQEKPAHTLYTLQKIEAQMRVGFQSRLGIDAIVGGTPDELVLPTTSQLGLNTVLSESSIPPNSLGQARIGR